MSIEFSYPTIEHSKEIVIPPETTHEEQLRGILDSLNAHGYAIVLGPSRAGKTTFLEHSLPAALQKNEYPDPLFVDCMTAAPRDASEALFTYETPIILDEVTRMIDSPVFLHSLKERIMARRPTVICATLFDDDTKNQVQTLFAELHTNEDPSVIIDFPISMSENDASHLIETILPGASDEFILGLTRLTTQPYFIRLILNEARKNGQASIESLAKSVLQNYPTNRSLLPEARSLWEKATTEPCPRWLSMQD